MTRAALGHRCSGCASLTQLLPDVKVKLPFSHWAGGVPQGNDATPVVSTALIEERGAYREAQAHP